MHTEDIRSMDCSHSQALYMYMVFKNYDFIFAITL